MFNFGNIKCQIYYIPDECSRFDSTTVDVYNGTMRDFNDGYIVKLVQKLVVVIIGAFELTYRLSMSLYSLSKFEFNRSKDESLLFVSTLLSTTSAMISIPLSILNCYEFNVFLDHNNTLSLSSSYFQEQCNKTINYRGTT